jgi:membrane-associated phospholipid phosphatase
VLRHFRHDHDPGRESHATVHPTRSLAILHAAIYDAVDSITRTGPSYLFSLDAPPGARPNAAAAQAGHDALAALYPSMGSTLDQQLAGELGAIPNGSGKQEGIEVGHVAAMLVLGARSSDGSGAIPPPYTAAPAPGVYQLTPPYVPAAVFTHWAHVTPFVLTSAGQFRPPPPPTLNSSAYAQATNEVKSLGAVNSSTRTADETTAAKFWSGPIWITWNEIAENEALAHHTSLVKTARLFALLNLSLADTAIAMYDAKYNYDFWRPVTAIRAADTGNADVVSDPTWTPLLTGSDPSYPGAHSAMSGAAATVLTHVFGAHDALKVTSNVVPGIVRIFDNFDAAATEAGISRIYGGVHTRLDHVAGLTIGTGSDAARMTADPIDPPMRARTAFTK